jgi:transcriptional regulator with XRE-family HTH domain
MATRSWKDVLADSKLSPTDVERINAEVDAKIERERMTLAQVRRAREMTQATIADNTGMTQGDVSKLERRTDAYVGTLRRYVEAMGGALRILAEFPDGAPVEIVGFGSLIPEPDNFLGRLFAEHVSDENAEILRNGDDLLIRLDVDGVRREIRISQEVEMSLAEIRDDVLTGSVKTLLQDRKSWPTGIVKIYTDRDAVVSYIHSGHPRSEDQVFFTAKIGDEPVSDTVKITTPRG